MFELLFKYPLTVYEKGSLVLQSGWSLWWWVLATAAAAGAVGWLLLRRWNNGRRARALVLWALQSTMIALVLLLLWQPGISIATLKPQQNIVAVLLDDSRSMALSEDGVSRRDQLKRTLEAGLADGLARKFQVRYYRMGARLSRTGDWKELTAEAPVSRLSEGLAQIAAESGSLPIGALVVMSDGGDTAGGIDRQTLATLRSRRFPVHTIGFGREKAEKDLALLDVQTPVRALADSRLSVMVRLEQRGYAGQRARLVLSEEGRTLTAREITLAADGKSQTENLLFNAGNAGAKTIKVTLQTLAGETNPGNNTLTRLVQVESRKPRILYLEGEPRWEFKFIRRALEEDRSINLVTLLRTTQNKIYRQGINTPAELEGGFPSTLDELFAFEGIVIGNVEAGYFSPTQVELLQQFVDRRGGGVLFLGGRTTLADGGYGASPLLELLPVNPGDRRTTFVRDRATVELTMAGQESLYARLDEDPARNLDRWKKLPYLADYQNPGTLKAGAVVLAESVTNKGRLPLWITQNYGQGRTAVLATSGTWRWQMAQPLEDKSHEVFWQQLSRWLVGATPGRVVALLPRTVFSDEQRIPLRAEVRNRQFLPLADGSVEARISGPDGVAATVPLQPDPVTPGVYLGEWGAEKPGSYLVEMYATRAGEEVGRDTISFRREDGVTEAYHTQQDRETLERLSAQTGGRYWTPQNVSRLPDEITYSEAGITTREVKDLWNIPLVFLLLALLRGGEWMLRRKWGAV
jgi:uncharacterized membrane protein